MKFNYLFWQFLLSNEWTQVRPFVNQMSVCVGMFVCVAVVSVDDKRRIWLMYSKRSKTYIQSFAEDHGLSDAQKFAVSIDFGSKGQ